MWCDNCLLLFPLPGHGAMAWDALIMVYSLAGGIFLYRYGAYFFFTFPEWDLYAAVSWAISLISFINIIALSNNSFMWARVCFFLWPFLLVISAVRASIMIFQLDRQQGKIIWECNNGGQLWGESVADGYDNGASMPSGVCSAGFHSLYIAFVLCLLADFGFQLYAYFMAWRFMKRLEHYMALATSEAKAYLY